jgi:cytochrome c biogenesis protein CcmG, thiol:disulfide interchange protein DsbE
MKNIALYLRFYFVAVLLLWGAANVSAQVKNLFTNKPLPDITIQDLDGKKVNIADYGKKEKVIILNFWATWCAPCKQELTNIHDLYADWQKLYDVELVAISIDDSRNISKVKSYVNGNRWNYTFLIDPNQDLRRAFNFQTPPFTVLIDKEGNIVSTHTGYKNGDEFILEDKIKELGKTK